MAVCGEPCEVYARIVGYYRPLSNWNKGKKQEHCERNPFDIKEVIASCEREGKKEGDKDAA